MPYGIRKVRGGYSVRNKRSGAVKAKRTSMAKAKRQIKAIYASKRKKR